MNISHTNVGEMIFDASKDVCVENGTHTQSSCASSAYQLNSTSIILSVFDTSTNDNRNIYGLEVAQGDSIVLNWNTGSNYYNLEFAQYNVGVNIELYCPTGVDCFSLTGVRSENYTLEINQSTHEEQRQVLGNIVKRKLTHEPGDIVYTKYYDNDINVYSNSSHISTHWGSGKLAVSWTKGRFAEAGIGTHTLYINSADITSGKKYRCM